MSNQYSAQPTNPSDSDSDRLRTLLDNLNNLKGKLNHFSVIDELGQPLGEITDLILDEGHQLNLVIALTDARSHGSPVLLNGRRIKKVSVQTQSVFVDITKADTQFLPEYSSVEGQSSLHLTDQPLPSPLSEPFAGLNFSEEPTPSTFSTEPYSTYPTAADRELAESLFATEPGELDNVEPLSLNQEWELSPANPVDDVFASWDESTNPSSDFNLLPDQELDLSNAVSFPESPDLTASLAEDLSGLELSSAELFGSTDEFSLSEPFTDSTTNFSLGDEPSSESLTNELERLDLSLDNDWSEVANAPQTEAASAISDLRLDSSLFTEASTFDRIEVEAASGESFLPDQSVNPFAGEFPDFALDAPSAPVEGLSDLDWTTTPAAAEPASFTLESDDFSFVLPAADPGTSLESASFDLSELEPASPSESADLASEWDEAAQLLELEEPVASAAPDEFSLGDLGEPNAPQADTIQSLSDLDIFGADQPSPVDVTAADEFSTPVAEEASSPAISEEFEPSTPAVFEEPERQNEWIAAAGAGVAGLAAGLAASSAGAHPEPLESVPEAVTSLPGQSSTELDATLPLLEEQLNVEYQRRKVGEVIIRKQVETRMVQVPVRYEKLIIEQVSPERKSLAEVDLSQGALDNIELTGVDEKPTVAGEFTSPAVASQALDAIAKALQNRCKRVRIEIELEDGQMQQAYQDWFNECSQL